MKRKIILAVCIAATLNMSAGLTGASAAPPRGGHSSGAHVSGGHGRGGSPGGGHFAGGGHYRGGSGRGYVRGGYGGGGYAGGGYVGAPYGYDNGYGPYGYDDGYDNGAAIAAGIIGTAIGAIAASQHRCWWQNHRRVCR
jgi:hypothetical protein